jgi:hypothetical protein
MRAKSFLFALTLMFVVPPSARAEWFVTPFLGGNFGGAADEPLFPGAVPSSMPLTLGVTGGWMRGRFGIEADLSRAPNFFDDDRGFVSDTSVLTLMGNGRFTMPIGAGRNFEPFVSGGAGLVRPNVAEAGGLAAVNTNKFGWNVGGGFTGYANAHVGFTGDLRYFRTMAGDDDVPNPFGLDFDRFDFWRATAGVSFRW